MNFENYEGTALDPEVFGQQETEPTSADDTIIDVQDVNVTTEPVETPPEVVEGPVTYNIEGVGTFTAEQIKEMQQGNLRQSDYTKKTQEVARQREEAKDALELYNYLRTNPHIVEAMKQAEANPNAVGRVVAPTTENEMLKQVLYNQRAMEADMKMSALKAKYGDVDEIAVYNKAAELKTDDLEFVYKALSYDANKTDQTAAIEAAKAQLMAELEANRGIVSTIVDNKQTSQVQKPVSLTSAEKRIAAAMGISESEYAKWKN
ncbi:MAG: hypothetical protein IJ297_03705 [Clostridia bacterium]|nr:hypothetical protein [Clostridia bacterium]